MVLVFSNGPVDHGSGLVIRKTLKLILDDSLLKIYYIVRIKGK